MTADSCLPWSPVALFSLRYSLAPLPLDVFMGASLHDLRFQVHIIASVFSPWYHGWVFLRRGSTSEGCFLVTVQV